MCVLKLGNRMFLKKMTETKEKGGEVSSQEMQKVHIRLERMGWPSGS